MVSPQLSCLGLKTELPAMSVPSNTLNFTRASSNNHALSHQEHQLQVMFKTKETVQRLHY